MAIQKTILIVTANPDDSEQIRTDKFVPSVQKGLSLAQKSNDYLVKYEAASDLNRFSVALETQKPNILVLAGHGDEVDRFVFETTNGGREFAKPNQFAEALGLYYEHLECVLVMSCHSQSLAKKITQYISYAVGYEEALLVDVAKEYVEKFFFYLACGNDYHTTNHKTRIFMKNKLSDNQIPQLFVKYTNINDNSTENKNDTIPSKPQNDTRMTYEEFIKEADNLLGNANFYGLFKLIDPLFADTPLYDYSNLRSNIKDKLNNDLMPSNAQRQALTIFINGDEVKKRLA